MAPLWHWNRGADFPPAMTRTMFWNTSEMSSSSSRAKAAAAAIRLPFISGKAVQKLIRAYDAAGVPMPAESVIRDICVLAAREHGFVYAGFTHHTYFKGPIKDPSNIVHFGIVKL